MDLETLAINQQKTEDRSLRNEVRIKKLEEEHEVLQQLATAVAVMAERMKTMSENVNGLTKKVEEIESKPGQRWDKLISATLGALAGAFIAWIVAGTPGL